MKKPPFSESGAATLSLSVIAGNQRLGEPVLGQPQASDSATPIRRVQPKGHNQDSAKSI